MTAKASEYVYTFKKYYESYGDRARLAEKNEGVDWKAVSHALRAGYQTRHIFAVGGFSYPLPETDFLMKVKLGELSYINVVAPALEDLIDELEGLSRLSPLPEKVDRKFWDEFLISVLQKEENWKLYEKLKHTSR